LSDPLVGRGFESEVFLSERAEPKLVLFILSKEPIYRRRSPSGPTYRYKVAFEIPNRSPMSTVETPDHEGIPILEDV